jgi:hypothetical protein
LLARVRELEAREDELTERLSRAPVDIPDIHPNVAGIYRRKVERDEAAEAIRSLIDRITLTPGPKRGEIAATLYGDLGTILEWVARKQNTPGRDGAGVSVSVVAGVGKRGSYNSEPGRPPAADGEVENGHQLAA